MSLVKKEYIQHQTHTAEIIA